MRRFLSKRVGVNRYKNVCLQLPRTVATIFQAHIVVTRANEDGLETGHTRKLLLKALGNLQHDGFFPQLSWTRGAGVLTTVSGIDGNDNISPRIETIDREYGVGIWR